MSKTVDQRVVEMQFDNKNFESNVATSMSTLDKLKNSLNFDGATKGFDNISRAAKGFDISPMGSAVDTVKAKFSALEVMAVTALANITNSVVNTAKRIVSEFTIQPITTGFNEYELKMNSVQTIMASTGESLETVNGYLDELNKYSDDTIYSFSDMTQNIGKFTNAGVKLKDAVAAIKGISNEAAVSGANAQEASRAMYNFAQALSAGYVKLIDWKSIENANMATVEFKNELINTALELGTVTKQGDKFVSTTTNLNGKVSDAFDATSNFNDSLAHQWMTTDVLTETLKKYADETTEIGKKATQAATEVKTFSMMMDTLKEAAQSGWAQTWEIIFGDFNEGKTLWTELANFFGDFISKMSDARNNLLKDVFESPFSKFQEKLAKITGKTEEFTEKVKDYGDIVDKVINGDYGSEVDRWDRLTQEGYDWAKVQNLVNEKLGDGTRYAEMLEEAQKELADQTAELSDEKLKELGFTEEEIKLYRELEEESRKTGKSISEIVESMDQMDGRTKVIESFKSVFSYLGEIFGKIREAWNETFDKPDIVGKLKSIIDKFYEFSQKLKLTDETAAKIKSTFKGLFAILDIIKQVVGGALNTIFQVLSETLGGVSINVLDITAYVGDAIVAFRDWLNENQYIAKTFGLVKTALSKLIEVISKAIGYVVEFVKAIDFSKIKDIGGNIIDGLINGLKNGISKIPDIMIELGKSILDTIKNFLGIHSPSTVMEEVGENTVSGLYKGIQNGVSSIIEVVKTIAEKIVETIKKINWRTVFAVGVSTVLVWFVKKIGDTVSAIAAPFSGLGSIFYGVGEILQEAAKGTKKVVKNFAKILKSFSKVLSAFAFSIKAKAIKDIAISIAILAGAVGILSLLDQNKLWSAIGALAVISAILVALVVVVDKLASLEKKVDGSTVNFGKLMLGLVGVSVSILLISSAIKKIGTVNAGQALQGILGIVAIVGGLVLLLKAYGDFVKGKSAQNIDKFGKMLLKLSISMLLISLVTKLAGNMDMAELEKGLLFAAGFSALVLALTGITKLGGKSVTKLGGMMLKMALAMGLMVGVVKLASSISAEEAEKGVAFAIAFSLFVGILAAITKTAESTGTKLGSTLLGISASMMLMALVVKIIENTSWEGLSKGFFGILAFEALILVLIRVIDSAEGNTPKIAITLLAMAGAIAILAGVSIVLSLIDLGGLIKGVLAVTLLGAIMTAMLWATKGANDCKANLIAMTIAIGVMAAAAAALSLIDTVKLTGATIALVSLIATFGMVAKYVGEVKGSIATLVAMTVAIGVLGTVLYLVSLLPVENTLPTAIALSALLLAMAGAMFIISNTGEISLKAYGALAIMVLVVGVLGVVLYLIGQLQIESMLASAIALSALILALSGAMMLLSGTSGTSLVGAAAMVVMAGALIVLAGALKILDGVPWQSLMASVLAFAGVILVLVGASALLQLVSVGALLLVAVLAALSVVLIAGAAAFYIFAQGLTVVGQALPLIGEGLTSCGEGLKNFIEQVASSKESVGDFASVMLQTGGSVLLFLVQVSAGMLIASAGAIALGGAAVVLGAGLLVASAGLAAVAVSVTLVSVAVLALCAAVSAGMQLIVGTFLNLVSFGKSSGENLLEGFVEGIKNGINSVINTVKEFASNVVNTVKDALGIHSPSTVMEEMGVYTDQGFANGITNGSGSVESAISSLMDKVKGWFGGGSNLPETLGDNGTEASGAFSSGLGDGVDSSQFLSQLTSSNFDTTSFGNLLSGNGTNAGGMFSSGLANGVDPSQFLSKISSGTFDTSSFSSVLGTSGNSAGTQFSSGTAAGVDPTKFLSQLTEGNFDTSSFESLLNTDGTSAGSGFSTGLADGVDFSQFQSMLSDGSIDTSSFESMLGTSGQNAGTSFSTGINQGASNVSLAPAMNSALDQIGSNRTRFQQAGVSLIVALSRGIQSGKEVVASKLNEVLVSAVKSITNSQGKFTKCGNQMMLMLSNGIRTGSNNVRNSVNTIMTTLISSITSRSPLFVQNGVMLMNSMSQGIRATVGTVRSSIMMVITACIEAITSRRTEFTQAGSQLMSAMAKGIQNGVSTVTSAVSSVTSSASSSILYAYDSFMYGGQCLVEGFAAGISANSYKAESAARAMASAAYRATKVELQIMSPSRKFKKLASFVPEGFAKGIDSMTWVVKDSAIGMAKVALNSTESALSKIGDIASGDKTITPTIRPVVDMSSVRTSNLEIGANIGAVMNRPIDSLSQLINNAQNEINASNNEVISAIKGLREDLQTYYSQDDSEIALYVDSKKLATSLAKPMNRQLNILSKRGAY